jgi:hypothetical protein
MAYCKTEEGQLAFKQRSPSLSARQRAAFIMFDGVKPVEQVLLATTGLGVTEADIDDMLVKGLLKENAVASVTRAVPVALAKADAAPASARSDQQRYAQAWPLATQLTASLGLRGFRLNLAVEAASGFDDLLALFPKIQAAVGVDKCAGLERVLKA